MSVSRDDHAPIRCATCRRLSVQKEEAGPRLGGRGDGEGLEGRAFDLNRWFRAEVRARRESVSRTVPLTDCSTSVLGKLEPSLETNGCGETPVKRAVPQRGESKVRRVKISPSLPGRGLRGGWGLTGLDAPKSHLQGGSMSPSARRRGHPPLRPVGATALSGRQGRSPALEREGEKMKRTLLPPR